MRLGLFAALSATVVASPIGHLSSRQATCVVPTANEDGTLGPFRIVTSGANDATLNNRYAQMSGAPTKGFIIFNTLNPNQGRVGEFYLDSTGHLLDLKGGVTRYAYNQVPPRYISLSEDKTVGQKIMCTISDTCVLDCKLPNGLNTDCLGSPNDRPEWRIGNAGVVKPFCPAFTPLAIGYTAPL